jgi:hypothetical protein
MNHELSTKICFASGGYTVFAALTLERWGIILGIVASLISSGYTAWKWYKDWRKDREARRK